jgi:hypothetical protein
MVIGVTVTGVILAGLSDHHALGPTGTQVLVAVAYGVLLMWAVLAVTTRTTGGS